MRLCRLYNEAALLKETGQGDTTIDLKADNLFILQPDSKVHLHATVSNRGSSPRLRSSSTPAEDISASSTGRTLSAGGGTRAP